jgi:hypothetical protein
MVLLRKNSLVAKLISIKVLTQLLVLMLMMVLRQDVAVVAVEVVVEVVVVVVEVRLQFLHLLLLTLLLNFFENTPSSTITCFSSELIWEWELLQLNLCSLTTSITSIQSPTTST